MISSATDRIKDFLIAMHAAPAERRHIGQA
jgi:hypothetical protein